MQLRRRPFVQPLGATPQIKPPAPDETAKGSPMTFACRRWTTRLMSASNCHEREELS